MTRNNELARFFIEQGCDVNLVDNRKMHAFAWCAIEQDNNVIAKLIIQAGGNINYAERDGKGMTPLIWCAAKNALKVGKLLIDAGANLDHIENFNKRSAVM
jgi:ankyrin repeat protein